MSIIVFFGVLILLLILSPFIIVFLFSVFGVVGLFLTAVWGAIATIGHHRNN